MKNERNLSIDMLSLTPHSEMNSTTTKGISLLINELNKTTQDLVKSYRKNRMVLKKKHEQSSIITTKLNRSIAEVKDTLKLINAFNKESGFREMKIKKNGKMILSRKKKRNN